MFRVWQCSHREPGLAGIRLLLSAIGQLFFPSSCLLCSAPLPGRPEVLFCPKCMGGIKFIHSPICPVCGRPFAAEEQPEHLCHTCLSKPYHFDRARAVTFYDGPILEAIHRFKFGKKIIHARTLAGLKSEDRLFSLDKFDLFVPVPLHVKRLRQRGFNQALLLLREWAGEEKEEKIDFTTLVRHRWTEPQTNLKHHERRKNIKGAFAVKRPDKVHGKNILLCDDVFTTGATVNECARVLKEAGAREVSVLTLARAIAQ